MQRDFPTPGSHVEPGYLSALGALDVWLVAVSERRIGMPATIWPGAAALAALLWVETAALASPAGPLFPALIGIAIVLVVPAGVE